MKNLSLAQITAHFLVVLLFLFAACGGEKKTETTQNLSVEEIKIKKDKKRVFVSPKKELLTEGELALEVAYPQFKSADSAQNVTMLNQLIKVMIDTTLARYVRDMQGIDASADEKTDTVAVTADEVPVYKNNVSIASRSMYIFYNIHRQTPNYVEIEFGFDEYAGGVHGLKSTATIHYDVAKGKNISLADLFTPNSDYLKQISTIVTTDLMSQKDQISSDSASIFAGAGAKEENFKNFLTKNDTLSVLFDPYVVAPYAAGPQVVKIPFSKIEAMLDKNSVILKSK